MKIFDVKYDEDHELLFFIIFCLISFIILFSLAISESLFEIKIHSLIVVLLITLVQMPFAYLILKFEEFQELKNFEHWNLHYKAIGLFTVFFFSVAFASALIFLMFPNTSIFNEQDSVIRAINNPVTGNFYAYFNYFISILANNLRVLFISLLSAIFVGAGSLFILNWNATVLGYAIGSFIYELIRINNPIYYALLKGTMKYLIHGVPEILAYVIGSFAGGILFTAIINHHNESKIFKRIVFDSYRLVLISIILLLIGALIETFITPLI
ncbi:MAG: stage II sporulation protein M [Candidatus Woesearchaeota archaeon]